MSCRLESALQLCNEDPGNPGPGSAALEPLVAWQTWWENRDINLIWKKNVGYGYWLSMAKKASGKLRVC